LWVAENDFDNRISAGHAAFLNSSSYTRFGYSSLADEGWVLVATRGSHRQFKHPAKSGRVTVPGKPSDELAPGTLNSIRKQAGFKR
jgi:predicted RNA binding protein YcfA (HicA-like mRNA interferase family)